MHLASTFLSPSGQLSFVQRPCFGRTISIRERSGNRLQRSLFRVGECLRAAHLRNRQEEMTQWSDCSRDFNSLLVWIMPILVMSDAYTPIDFHPLIRSPFHLLSITDAEDNGWAATSWMRKQAPQKEIPVPAAVKPIHWIYLNGPVCAHTLLSLLPLVWDGRSFCT